jgi:hypothetical protein
LAPTTLTTALPSLPLDRRARETVTAREVQEQKEAEQVEKKEQEFLQRKTESRNLLGETIKREMAVSK